MRIYPRRATYNHEGSANNEEMLKREDVILTFSASVAQSTKYIRLKPYRYHKHPERRYNVSRPQCPSC